VRITAQPHQRRDRFHAVVTDLRSDFGDIPRAADEIRSAVTTALQATLLLTPPPSLSSAGRKTLAFDAYLRGQRFVDTARDKEARSAQVAAYLEGDQSGSALCESVRGQSLALIGLPSNVANGPAIVKPTRRHARRRRKRCAGAGTG